jgi:hypothetical protein
MFKLTLLQHPFAHRQVTWVQIECSLKSVNTTLQKVPIWLCVHSSHSHLANFSNDIIHTIALAQRVSCWCPHPQASVAYRLSLHDQLRMQMPRDSPD